MGISNGLLSQQTGSGDPACRSLRDHPPTACPQDPSIDPGHHGRSAQPET